MCTFLAHGHPDLHQDPRAIFWKAALQLISPQHVLVPGVFSAFVELQEIPHWPAFQPVKAESAAMVTPPSFASSANSVRCTLSLHPGH